MEFITPGSFCVFHQCIPLSYFCKFNFNCYKILISIMRSTVYVRTIFFKLPFYYFTILLSNQRQDGIQYIYIIQYLYFLIYFSNNELFTSPLDVFFLNKFLFSCLIHQSILLRQFFKLLYFLILFSLIFLVDTIEFQIHKL